MSAPTLLWLRQDLRLADQPALAAARADGPVIPVYVLDDEAPGHWRIGGAQRWWLHHSLAALAESLEERGSRLILRRGRAEDVLAGLAEETGAAAVHAIRHCEPWWIAAEERLAERLDLRRHDGNELAPPRDVRTGAGGGYRVFGPFWRALSAMMPPAPPVPAPDTIPSPARWPESETLASWALLPTRPDWSTGFGPAWTPGEAGGRALLDRFAGEVDGYATARNLPSRDGSSRLSPHLHFGELSAAQVWHATRGGSEGRASFHRELGWRDFTRGLVRQLPDYADANGRKAFDRFPWRPLSDPAAKADFAAWTRGRTGYPIVDAGMRQLWAIGWMHNRVRMITASFLIKHLLIDWREGERWFWETLLCADHGNNSVNWQWTAGSGVDSNPFGRIMAPLTQSPKFEAGEYIRAWVPELAGVPDPAIHDPHEAGCAPAGYPEKRIGHREGRERALAAGAKVRA